MPKYSVCTFQRSLTGIFSTLEGAHWLKASPSTKPVPYRMAEFHSQPLANRQPNASPAMSVDCVVGP